MADIDRANWIATHLAKFAKGDHEPQYSYELLRDGDRVRFDLIERHTPVATSSAPAYDVLISLMGKLP